MFPENVPLRGRPGQALATAEALLWRSNLGDWLVTTLLPKFGQLGVKTTDIMVLNFAVWINHAAPLERNLTLWSEYYQKFKDDLPFTIWRDASIQHFDTPTGAGLGPCIGLSWPKALS
jgi:hypothetical protein